MPTIEVWAVDFLESHPGVCLGDFWEQDITSNNLGFLPNRPSLALMVMARDYVQSRTARQQRKVESRRAFEEWQSRRTVRPSNYSLVIDLRSDVQDFTLAGFEESLFAEPARPDQLLTSGVEVLEDPESSAMVFEPDTLEARLVYAVFDILHQQVMRRKQ